ncbi:MAG: alginate export family protein, partial [Candidatus Omnitrophica bacterium]|nr:alginate export family protein [Candidatus Omnitrophota bacterium]
GDDGADWFMSVAQVEVAADLTDNVSVVINIYNQRDWNANQWIISNNTSNIGNEFDLGVDLAYVQLKEAFYAPLTLTIGRQDIEFGRGFVLGNFQIQDPQGTVIADEFSAVTSFDAFRATLDFAPWTIDSVVINPALGGANQGQGSANAEDDRYVWFNNVNYQFSEYNAEWEGYFAVDHDRATNQADAMNTGAIEKTWMIGTRAQFDPVQNLTIGGEVAFQWGESYATSTSVTALDREAWGLDVFGQYTWYENAYTPWVGLEYVFLSGDDATNGTDFGSWNGLFRSPTYGAIFEYLNVLYNTAANTVDATSPTAASNHQHFSISGGLSPMEDLALDATFYWFWTDEDVITAAPANGGNLGQDVGTELDINVIYDYTEDVTFNLGLAWFMPGDVYGVSTATGATTSTATQVTSGVSVVF